MKFELRITLGNVLTIGAGILFAGGLFYQAGEWKAQIEGRLASIEQNQDDMRCALVYAGLLSTITRPCFSRNESVVPIGRRDDHRAPVGAVR